MVAFPLLTTPCLGVGMVAAGLLGCWSGTGPPTCTKTQAWLLASPRVQHIPNRAIDSTSNSATLLKAVQMQHKCDKNTCLVTDKHTQFQKFAGKAQVPSHRRSTCDTFQYVFASSAGSHQCFCHQAGCVLLSNSHRAKNVEGLPLACVSMRTYATAINMC